ncbi:MAG: helix-turn-helix domain-containing protein [Synergistaceae bacterium]|nr:helix-turn-helix domain-containing protein [Synergistaceae bacterium]
MSEKIKKGKKTRYDPDITPKLAESYAMEGYSDDQIALKLGIHRSSFYDWQKLYPELRAAVKRGKEPVNAEIKMAMIKSATGYYVEEEQTVAILDVKTRQPKSFKKTTTKKFIPPSPTTQIFLAKNRMPELFRDVNRYEITGRDGAPVAVTNTYDLSRLSETELKELDRILEKTENTDPQGDTAAAQESS